MIKRKKPLTQEQARSAALKALGDFFSKPTGGASAKVAFALHYYQDAWIAGKASR